MIVDYFEDNTVTLCSFPILVDGSGQFDARLGFIVLVDIDYAVPNEMSLDYTAGGIHVYLFQNANNFLCWEADMHD